MMTDPTTYLDSGSLRDFVHAASSEPVLGEEEEAALVEALRLGDTEASDRLIRLHLRDAVDEAILHRGDVAVRTLIQQAVRGLVEAANRYQPARDGAFRSYARSWMKREIRATVLRD
jgi:DNA-directed RNA polymerase sigma subunit (sigma70/sigma32)